jgi:2',3'-cyclic-nucleotide 2'-phosphodiesterase (5'-nucleotidase family)
VLDSGDAFFKADILPNNTREADILKAETILSGYERIGYDCINVGGFDFANGKEFLFGLQNTSKIPFISANIVDTETAQPVFDPYVIVERQGMKIGIVGLSDHLPAHVEGLGVDDVFSSGKRYLAEVEQKSDITIILANVDRKITKDLRKHFPSANYIFLSKTRSRTQPGNIQPEGPMIYSTGIQGKYLAKVDVSFRNGNEPILYTSPKNAELERINRRLKNLQKRNPETPLEELYAGQPNVLNIVNEYRAKKEMIESELSDAANTSEYQLMDLSRKVESDPGLLAIVNDVLAACDELTGKTKSSG